MTGLACDPEARHELAELFLDIQRQGMTLLVSSHILAELEAYCTDMLVLRQGRIIELVVVNDACPIQTYKPLWAGALFLACIQSGFIVNLLNRCWKASI